MNGHNGGVPDLGQMQQRPTHMAPNLAVFMKELPEAGAVPIPATQAEGRALYMDANEMLDAIEEIVRRVVREEMGAMLIGTLSTEMTDADMEAMITHIDGREEMGKP